MACDRGARVNTGHDNESITAVVKAIQRITDVIVQQNQRAAQQEEATTKAQNLSEFRRNNPPQFKGEFDPEKANLWIKELEKIFRGMRCTDERKVTFATFMLVGDGKDWWAGAQRLLKAEGRMITWEVFRNKFLEKYFSASMRLAKEMEFLGLKQGGMTINAYAARFESLSKFSRYFQLQPDEEWKCRKFEDGLRHDLKRAVLPLGIGQFPTLLDKCRRIEELNQCRDTRNRNFGPSRFQRGKNSNVNRFQQKPYSRPPGNQPQQQSYGGSSDSNRFGQTVTCSSKCLKCEKDHLTKDCTIKGIICFRCRKPGHISKDCNQPKAEPSVSNVRAARPQAGGRVYTMSGAEASQSEDLITRDCAIGENMQINCEASLKYVQGKGFPCNLHCNGSSMEVFTTELKNEPGTYTAGDIAETDSPLGSEFLEPSNKFHSKPTYHHDYRTLAACRYNSHKVQQCQVNAFEGHFYPYPVENQFQYAPISMFAEGYPRDFQYQEFQYFVVIDFEATCDKDKNPHPQEIIEFPSVIVSSVTGQLEACFQTYVRPTCNQLLSGFCKDLTGIQQIQVDRGVTLSEALLRHDKWLENKGIKNTNFAVVTWSNWDCRVMLESECRFKKIRKPPYFNRWINLKIPFCEVFGVARCNLKEAVEMAGLAWQGRAHCGLDDAKNTARLLALLMHRGFKFSFTSSIMWQTADRSLMWKQSPEQPSVFPHSPHKAKDMNTPMFQYNPCCYCGVKSSRGMVRKPGPKQGSLFFGCGNWTATRGARCQYFEWASA